MPLTSITGVLEETMLKRSAIGLIAVAGVVIFANVSDAACTVIGGKTVCWSGTTRSEVCHLEVRGSIVDDPEIAVARCTASDLVGKSFCLNPQSRAQKASLIATSFTLEGTFLSDISAVASCSRREGKCFADIELDFDQTTAQQLDLCTNDNWQFITFTAESWTMTGDVCPSGFATLPEWPALPTCLGGEEAIRLVQTCTVDLTGYRPGDIRPYACELQVTTP
jgi:hypothetical protein